MAKGTSDFFEAHFRRQGTTSDLSLNAFQQAILPVLSGRVLDLGCGLGALSVAAARKGCEVVAVDASPTAIERLATIARQERLPITTVKQDIATFEFDGSFDAVVAIGVLMFFPREVALGLLQKIRHAVRPGGHAAVTVLLEGTTFLDVFGGDPHHLFSPDELERAFAGWHMQTWTCGEFPAANGTVKRIGSLIARKP